ncbi:MAG: hypothetical protein ACREF3_02600, partial [Acetobacteraceae bacterium]
MSGTAALPARPAWQPPSLWIAPPLLVLAVLFFYPLALIAAQSFAGTHSPTLDNYAGVLGSTLFH